jgi:hypothetical protein
MAHMIDTTTGKSAIALRWANPMAWTWSSLDA